MQGRYFQEGLNETLVEVEIKPQLLRFQSGSKLKELRVSDIIEVSYPGKNRALVSFQGGSLLLEAPNIQGTLRHFLGSFNEKVSIADRWKGRGLWILLIVGSSFIGILLLAYFLLLPWLADQAAIHFPKDQEIALGKELKASYLSTERIDSSKTKLLNDFASQLDLGKDFPSDYTVVDADIVNAYALPGGPIVVYSGIINRMENWQELAGLLAHERTHVLRHHSTRSLFRNASGVLMLQLVLGDASSTLNLFAQQGQQLQQLAYSRDLELEADREGLQLLVKNHINPQGMISLLEKLKKESSSSEFPEFLSTHPLPDSRLDALKKLVDEHPEKDSNPRLDSIWLRLKNPSPSPSPSTSSGGGGGEF